jgi:phosphatidylserine decarboxylase
MSVGHAPGEPQWAPDMRKGDDEITEADKAEAKRRIQGQVAEESPDEGGGSSSGLEGEEMMGASAGSVKVPPMASMAG